VKSWETRKRKAAVTNPGKSQAEDETRGPSGRRQGHKVPKRSIKNWVTDREGGSCLTMKMVVGPSRMGPGERRKAGGVKKNHEPRPPVLLGRAESREVGVLETRKSKKRGSRLGRKWGKQR